MGSPLSQTQLRKEPVDRWIDELALYTATLYPLVFWHTHLPRPFQWFVQGDFAVGVPAIVEVIGFWLWLLAVAAFVARQVVRSVRRQPISWGKVALVMTTVATWYAGIVIWRNDFAFTVTNVVAHGVPYMAISYRVGAHRHQSKADEQRSFVGALFRPGHALPFLAMLGALAFTEEWLWDAAVWQEHGSIFIGAAMFPQVQSALTLIVPLLAVPQVTHYVLDAYIWKLDGSNPGLDQALGV